MPFRSSRSWSLVIAWPFVQGFIHTVTNPGFTTDTEGTEKTFCLSGDTDKQTYPCHTYFYKTGVVCFLKSSRGYFPLSVSPDRGKMKSPPCPPRLRGEYVSGFTKTCAWGTDAKPGLPRRSCFF